MLPTMKPLSHNVSKQDFESGVTYYDLMKKNLIVLKEALY